MTCLRSAQSMGLIGTERAVHSNAAITLTNSELENDALREICVETSDNDYPQREGPLSQRKSIGATGRPPLYSPVCTSVYAQYAHMNLPAVFCAPPGLRAMSYRRVA